MAFCTKCGNQNSDTTKFCTRCGNALIKAATQVPVQAPANKNVVPEVIQNTAFPPKKNKWILPVAGGGALVIIGILCYFLFIKKDGSTSSSGNDVYQDSVTKAESVTSDTTTVVPVTPQTNTTATYSGALFQRNEGSTISDGEIQILSENINKLYTAENSKDYTTAMSYFSIPVSKYYNFSNLSYQQMNDVYLQSDAKLVYHENLIDISASSAEKTNYGYRLTIVGEYKFATIKNPDSTRLHTVKAELLLNNDYKIFSARDVR